MKRERRALTVYALTTCLLLIAASATIAANPKRPRFTHPARINNRWLPMRPGTKLSYTGSEYVDKYRVHHRVVFIVTDLVKVIDGVRTVVVWDRDYVNGKLVEGELAFNAQDEAGSVWLFGEYPEEYNHGKVTGAPDTWISGIARAERGLAMPAAPRTATPSYAQGRAPEIGFADRAEVHKTHQHTCVSEGCYKNILVIEEWSPSEPGQRQFKYYATGIGNIRVGFSGSGQREDLELLSVSHLNAKNMARVDADALAIDRRAYRISRRVYAKTAPAEKR